MLRLQLPSNALTLLTSRKLRYTLFFFFTVLRENMFDVKKVYFTVYLFGAQATMEG